MILRFTLDSAETSGADIAHAGSSDAAGAATSLHFWTQLLRFAERRAQVLQDAFRPHVPASELQSVCRRGARGEHWPFDHSPPDAA
jgi:hypothetical protein